MADQWDQFKDATDAVAAADLYAQYPGLKKFDVQIMDSSATGADWRGQPYAGRKMEFYPPDESYNPSPGRPTIELFSKDVGAKDALGEIFSHYLPNVDPEFRAVREKFIASIDPKQKEMLYGDYMSQIRSGVFNGKNPSFDQWLKTNGGDAFFRGYVADQYPKEFYRADQIRMFEPLMSKLSQEAPANDPWAQFKDAETPKPLSGNDVAVAATSGGYSGIANMLGLPVDTALNVADLTKAGMGLIQGAVTKKPPSDVFLPSDRSKYVGSSAWVKNKMNQAGAVTENPRPDSRAARWLNKGAEIGTGVYLGSAIPSQPRPPPLYPSRDWVAPGYRGSANASANSAANANVNVGAGQAGAAAGVQGSLNASVRGGGYNFGTVADDAASGLTPGQQSAATNFSQGLLTPGQATGNKLLQRLEAKLESQPMTAGPFDRIKDANIREVNKAAAKAIGETADNLSSEVLDRAVTRMGQVFEDVRDATIRKIEPADYVNRISSIQDEFESIGPQLMNHPLVERLVKIAEKGEASGKDLGSLTSKLTREVNRQMTSAQGDRELGIALSKVKDYVDDLVAQGLSGDKLKAYEAARQQYRNFMLLTSRVGTINPATGNINGGALANALQQVDRNGYLLGRNTSDMYNAARFAQAFKPIVGDSGTATRMPLPSPTDFIVSLPFNLATRAYTSSPAVNAALRTQAAANAAAQGASAAGRAVAPMITPGGLLGAMAAQDELRYRR